MYNQSYHSKFYLDITLVTKLIIYFQKFQNYKIIIATYCFYYKLSIHNEN